MYLYRNGDKCPCCGQEITGKSEEWLRMFSITVSVIGLEPVDERRAGVGAPYGDEQGADMALAPAREVLTSA